MMKKLAAILLTLCLLTGCALAEEATVEEINWSDVEMLASMVDGEFWALSDTGLKMYIPSDMTDRELTQEQLDGGTFLIMGTEGDTFMLTAQILPVPMDQFKTLLISAGAEEVEEGLLNGINCVSYTLTDANGIKAAGVAFYAAGGEQVITVSVAPLTDEESVRAAVMMASIQVIE